MRRRARAEERLGRWLLLAVGLHAAIAVALLIGPRLLPALPLSPAQELAQIEFVQVDPQHIGEADPHAGGSGPGAPQPQPPAKEAEQATVETKPENAPKPAAQAAPVPAPDDQDEPAPATEAAPPDRQAMAPTQQQVSVAPRPSPVAVRLGDDAPLEDSSAGAFAFGPAVVPARPDAAAHNSPPAYPRDAARRGEQGTVILVIHIAQDGSVSGVDVERSSGSASLDDAARNAAEKWHFRPALSSGAALASDFTLKVTFQL